MECNRQIFLRFWTIVCPFALTTQRIKIWKNEKTAWRYYHFIHVYHKWQSYDVWFLRYGAWQTFFVILDNFLHFYPPNNPKNQNFVKMKESPGDIIPLYMCTINENHMMYGSWDMECVTDRIFVSFRTVFCTFTTLTTQKIKILKNWKKHLEISSFYASAPKIMIICYTVP